MAAPAEMTPQSTARAARRKLARFAASPVAPLLGYALFTLVWLGRGVILHPEVRVLGDRFPDKTIIMWSFLWWPHELAHGHDPFLASAIWAPHGIDLAWVTAVPGISLLLVPFSETLGPVFAYNLAALAAAPLAAWTAYLLARRLTKSVSAALVAGFLFGFSPYLIGQAGSHLNLSFVFLIPLIGWLAVAFVQGDLSPWRYVGFGALALASQFYFSTEIAASLPLVGAICLVLAFLLLPQSRSPLRALAAYTGLAYGVAGVLVAPYLVHVFSGTTPPARGNITASEDLANLVVPTRVTWLRPPGSSPIVHHFASNGAEQGAYLGLPLLLILVLAAAQLRALWRRGLWVLLLAAAASTLLALGARMRIDGHTIATGVWQWIGKLPAIHSALPVRLDLYTGLFAALAAALWLAQPSRRRAWRFTLAGIAIVAFLPSPSGARWSSSVPQSSFFDTTAYRQYVHPGETVLVLPYGPTGWSMLWQAEAHFGFSIVGGWVGRLITKPECRWYWEYRALVGVRPPDNGAAFRRFLLAHRVRAVIEGPGTQKGAERLIAASLLDVRRARVADATVLRLPPNLPAALPKNAPRLRPASHPQAPPAGLPCTVPPYSQS